MPCFEVKAFIGIRADTPNQAYQKLQDLVISLPIDHADLLFVSLDDGEFGVEEIEDEEESDGPQPATL
jgi:hypothetical protein